MPEANCNGTVERLVRTMKILVAKFAGATHDWQALRPRACMERMQRRLSVTKYANELVLAHRLRLLPPVGPQLAPSRMASVTDGIKFSAADRGMCAQERCSCGIDGSMGVQQR